MGLNYERLFLVLLDMISFLFFSLFFPFPIYNLSLILVKLISFFFICDGDLFLMYFKMTPHPTSPLSSTRRVSMEM